MRCKVLLRSPGKLTLGCAVQPAGRQLLGDDTYRHGANHLGAYLLIVLKNLIIEIEIEIQPFVLIGVGE